MRRLLTLTTLSLCVAVYGQKKMTKEEYISKYYALAVEEMNRYNIPASITLAQGLHETANGNSGLAVIGKNHFGIKCKKNWTGKTYYKDDDAPNECFRAYYSVEDSYRDHSVFLSSNQRYSKLFTYDMSDYKSWAYGLKQAGYATNTKYPVILISLIEDYKLYRYDNFGRDKKKYIAPVEKESVVIKMPEAKKVDKNIVTNGLKKTKVGPNFSLSTVSKKYKIPIEKLVKYNDCAGEQMLSIGQNFFLEEKKASNPLMIHKVKMGETLYAISQMYGVKLDVLRKYNNLKSWEQPQTGERVFLSRNTPNKIRTVEYFEVLKNIIRIPEVDSKGLSVTSTAGSKKDNNNLLTEVKDHSLEGVSKETKVMRVNNLQSHIVGNNDSIFKIAKKFNCSPAEILKWNGLSIEDELKPGQEILIFK